MPIVSPCLGIHDQAQEAGAFYVSLFPNAMTRRASDTILRVYRGGD